MEEQKEIEEMKQIQQPPWLVNNILFSYEGETKQGMTARESSTSYNTKKTTVITRNPTLIDQIVQEGK